MIALKYKDNRIRYFEQENKGVSAARNLGLAHMKGDYFCFLDSDDVLPVYSIESRIKIFNKFPELDFVDGQVIKKDHQLKETLKIWSPSFRGNPLRDLVKLTGRSFLGLTWMVKRKSGKSYKLQDGLTHCEDLYFYLKH